MTGSGPEGAHTSASPSFADTVAFAFADPGAELYGFLRLSLAPPEDEQARRGSAAAALLGRSGLIASAGAAGVPVPAAADWDAFALAGVATTTPRPLEAWSAAFVDSRTDVQVELTFEAAGAPAELAGLHPAGGSGGLEGYAQACRVQGTARIGDDARPIACRGQRDHTWGDVDWRLVEAVESTGLWLGDETALALRSLRLREQPDATWARPLGPPPGEASAARARAEALGGCTLDLGDLALDLAFLVWTIDGRQAGVGHRETLRLGTSGQPS